jgi:predicted Fe-Mo cluster-binding NifX family protein
MPRIAVSADDNKGLDSVVSPHFGRCPYYAVIDVEDHHVESLSALKNPFYGQHSPGAVPRFIQEQGADVILTGGMGRRAIGFFRQMGIEAVTGAYGSVRNALEAYLGGELIGAKACEVSSEHGRAESKGEYEQDDVGRLREEAEMLQDQLDEIMARIDKSLGDLDS